MVELTAALLRDHHFSRVIRNLWEGTVEFGRFLRNLPSSIDIGKLKIEIREGTNVSEQWDAYGERIMALLASEELSLLLLIDEFAIMVSCIAERSHEDAKKLLRRYIQAIFFSRQINLEPEVSDTILELVGTPIPYLLAVLLTAVFDRHRAMHGVHGPDISLYGTVTVEMVKAAFEDDLLGGATSAVFQHYRSRIGQYYPGQEGQAAKAILGVLSRSESPVKQDRLYLIFLKSGNLQPSMQTQEDFMRLMRKLDNDFYIVTQDRSPASCTSPSTSPSYAFFSRVLQAWWRNHYGFQGE